MGTFEDEEIFIPGHVIRILQLSFVATAFVNRVKVIENSLRPRW